VIIFIVPKNSGLAICKEISKEYHGEVLEVRGEDVPLFVKRLSQQNKNVVGITGEDLFKEFLMNNTNSGVSILQRIIWNDAECIYGKPTLCLLGDKYKNLKEMNRILKVCINKKYAKIAKKFLSRLEEYEGFVFEKMYLTGSTESAFEKKLVDLVIDIVYSGKSAEKAGLKVYDKIFESDLVVLEYKPQKIEDSNNKRFELGDLLKKINDQIESDNEDSYTKKLITNPELLKRKLIEEAAEVITSKNKEEFIWECSDLIYFLFVTMAKEGISLEDINKENSRRNEE
jgi:phosphoribosyl-ATP pyrophosphohydrolase